MKKGGWMDFDNSGHVEPWESWVGYEIFREVFPSEPEDEGSEDGDHEPEG